jgi:hypothetical protein
MEEEGSCFFGEGLIKLARSVLQKRKNGVGKNCIDLDGDVRCSFRRLARV